MNCLFADYKVLAGSASTKLNPYQLQRIEK